MTALASIRRRGGELSASWLAALRKMTGLKSCKPPQFFLPIVATTIAESLRDRAYTTRLRTLDFRIDWSAADEIMDIVVDTALRGAPHEVVVASGMTVYAREVVSGIFARYGLDARRHLLEDLAPAEPGPQFTVGIDCLVEGQRSPPAQDCGRHRRRHARGSA